MPPFLGPFNSVPPMLGQDSVSCDCKFDRIDDVGVRSRAKQEYVFSRPTRVVRVVRVAFLGSDEDVTARKAQEPIAAATFSEVEGHVS